MRKLLLSLSATIALIAAYPALAQETQAADPEATWDLTDLYPTLDAWSQARDEVMADFEKIDSLRGTLGENADSLYTTL